MGNARLNIRMATLVSLALSFVLVISMIWMAGGALTRLSDNTGRLIHSNTVMDTLDSIMIHMVDMEAGERGYIIANNDDFLDPHRHALGIVYELRDELVRLLAEDPSEQGRLADITKHIDTKVAVSRANVEARKHSFEAARDRIAEGIGKREMDALRKTVKEMSQSQSKRRDRLRSQREATMNELKRNMMIASVLFVVMLICLYFYLLRMARLMHEAEQQATHLAAHDVLTGLPNRRLMLEHLNQAIQRCVRHKKGMALLFLDLNGFKPVNDKYGHEAGDEVLKHVARRLSDTMRASDMVARLGGDEFVVLAEDIADKDDMCDIARKIHAEIERPILLREWGEVAVSSSIGVAIYPQDGEDMETLLSNADTAMYEAKRTHSNCFCKEQKQLRRCMARDDEEGK